MQSLIRKNVAEKKSVVKSYSGTDTSWFSFSKLETSQKLTHVVPSQWRLIKVETYPESF